MNRNFVAGIDVGTYHVKVVVIDTSKLNEKRMPAIVSTGIAETRGVRHGYIKNKSEVTKSIKEAVAKAEKNLTFRIKRAYFSAGGIGVQSTVATGSTIVSRADLEVTSLDIKKAHEEAEESVTTAALINKKALNAIPIQYKLDGKLVLGNPEGMRGSKLDVKLLLITCLEQHLNDLVVSAEDAGIEVLDVIPAPLAASYVTLSKTQRIAGCVLTNIGAETVSIAVFENDIPISLEVFPIGSSTVTNDIALGLKVPLEEAEQIKVGQIASSSFPRRKIEEIISARLSDIFEIIENHLKKIGKNGLLPAGIIITGGGSGLSNIEDLAKAALRIPSKLGSIGGSTEKESFRDSTWAVAYGLCLCADKESDLNPITSPNPLGNSFKQLGRWLKKFLP